MPLTPDERKLQHEEAQLARVAHALSMLRSAMQADDKLFTQGNVLLYEELEGLRELQAERVHDVYLRILVRKAQRLHPGAARMRPEDLRQAFLRARERTGS